MQQRRQIPLGATTFALRIDSYKEGQMQGAVYGSLLPEPLDFQSFPQLVLLLDELMDNDEVSLNDVQRDFSFTPTFELEIRFRQHHSWQGRLRQVGANREIPFRSVLELIVAFELILGK